MQRTDVSSSPADEGVLTGSPLFIVPAAMSVTHQGLRVCVEHVRQGAIITDFYFMSLLQTLMLKKIDFFRSLKRKGQ